MRIEMTYDVESGRSHELLVDCDIQAHREDRGIGSYEYWGIHGNQKCMETVVDSVSIYDVWVCLFGRKRKVNVGKQFRQLLEYKITEKFESKDGGSLA